MKRILIAMLGLFAYPTSVKATECESQYSSAEVEQRIELHRENTLKQIKGIAKEIADVDAAGKGTSTCFAAEMGGGKSTLLIELAQRLREQGRIVICIKVITGDAKANPVSKITPRATNQEVECINIDANTNVAERLTEIAKSEAEKNPGKEIIFCIDEAQFLTKRQAKQIINLFKNPTEQNSIMKNTRIYLFGLKTFTDGRMWPASQMFLDNGMLVELTTKPYCPCCGGAADTTVLMEVIKETEEGMTLKIHIGVGKVLSTEDGGRYGDFCKKCLEELIKKGKRIDNDSVVVELGQSIMRSIYEISRIKDSTK